HVEHSPIEETAPLARAPLDDGVQAGFDRVYRQQRCQLRHAYGRLPVDLLLQPAGPIRHAEPARRAIDVRLTEHGKTIGAVAYEPTHLPGPERPAAPENEHTLEQARLTGPVRAKHVVALRMERELDFAEAPKRRDADSAQRQEQRLGAPTRPLEAHRHDDELRALAAGFADQAARIAIGDAEL